MNRIYQNRGINNSIFFGKIFLRRFSTTKKQLNSNEASTVASKPKVPKVTTLDNGIRVATIDWEFNGGAIGLAINTGPRYETPEEYGASLFCDKLFLKSGKKYSLEQIMIETETCAAQVFTTSTREQLLFSVECLPRDIPGMLDIIADSIISPRFDEIEFEEQRVAIQFSLLNTINSAELWANEAITAVAFGEDTPLGRPNLDLAGVSNMTIDQVKNFQSKWYVPSRMVFCGLGIAHDELVGHVQNLFGHLLPDNLPVNKNASLTVPYYPPPPGEPAAYRGGYQFVEDHRKNEIGITLPGNFESFSSVVLAFPAPGYYEKRKYYASFILGYLLGSGSSFSSGGPGKGMFSRVYTRVLCYGFIDSGTFIYNPYYETGIFGLNVSGIHDYLKNIQELSIVEMLGLQKISEEEFNRAKNQLRSLIFMNLENTGAAIDDFLRQVSMYNTRADFDYHLSIIDNISLEEVTSLATEMLSSPPSILIRSESADPAIPYAAIVKFIK